jgi:hypothetical protein
MLTVDKVVEVDMVFARVGTAGGWFVGAGTASVGLRWADTVAAE